MTVVMKGGPSGNRRDYLPSVPTSGSPQPILKTETSGAVPSNIHMEGGSSGNREGDKLAKMPTGATIPTGSTDIEDPGARR